MMTKVLVYGYCVGVFSSRRIQLRLALALITETAIVISKRHPTPQ
jgi:hypothetical protein